MGAATAQRFAKAGAKVAILDLNLNAAKAIADEIGGHAFECDVANESQVTKVIESITKELGDIRACIQCAGVLAPRRVVGREGPMPLDDFKRMIDINLIGTFNILRLVAHQMSGAEPVGDSNERGVIINTVSIAAFEGQIGQAGYSAAKGGIVAMILPIARELARFGIRVLGIAPGIIKTPMIAGLSEEVQESLANEILFPKRLGSPDEFASLAEHMVENAYLNGTVFRFDAGIRLKEQ